jgi:phosphonate transport system permease protein
MSQSKRRRSGILAGALSLVVPGLGQAYAGRKKRGLAVFLVVACQAALLVGLKAYGLVAWIGLVWLWNIRDAERTAAGQPMSVAVPAVILLLVNFAAGWKVTQFDLVALQTGLLSNNARAIVSGLFRPDIVSPRQRTETASAKYFVGQAPTPAAPAKGKTRLIIDRTLLSEGEWSTVTGTGFPPRRDGMLYLLGGAELPLEPFTTDRQGRFSVRFRNPRSVPGEYWIEARVTVPTGGWRPSQTLTLTSGKMLETIFIALMGTVLSLVVTIPLSFFGARNLTSQIPLGSVLYSATRTVFNLLRSVEVMIVAIIMAVVVGFGPFAGVLALAIHGIGALGKLYSEAIESIDSGPMEAIAATGASPLQVVMFGVVPQVVPQFVAFTIYRWDINVRMATVIGLVGGGGIGYILMQYINLTQWRQAGTAIWLIAAAVMIMDYASAVIRERIV